MAWNDFKIWFYHNQFTFYGVIIILLLVGYDYGTLQSKIKENVEACNNHWVNEIERACPGVLTSGYRPEPINLSQMGLDNINFSVIK